MSTSFASLSTFKIDVTELEDLRQRLAQFRQQTGPLFDSVRPTFGAYMVYSGVLEFGWRDGRMARFSTQGGATVVSSTGVPHIYPAVLNNKKFLFTHLNEWFRKELLPGLARKGKGGIATSAKKSSLEQLWGRILNDKPRRDAVYNAPYRYGYHRRSIQGSGQPVPPSEIARMRAEAAAGARAAAQKAKAQRDIASGKRMKLTPTS